MRVAIVAVAFCLVPVVATPKSLGDAARQEAKKRAGEAIPVRTYSDADLRSRPAPLLPDAGTPAAAAAAAKGARPAAPEQAVRVQLDREEQARREREAYWRALTREALGELERAQSELEDCRLNGG